MAGETTVTDVNGVQKRVYDKSGLKNALPGSSVLQREIGFDGGSRMVGESYQFGVVLQPPNGFTFVGSGGAITTLKQGRPMLIKQAAITPFEMDLREQYAWAALSRAAEQGEGAMAAITGEILKAMKFSASNRLEATMLLGQYGLGTVDSVSGSGGTAVIVITEATAASGLWWALGPGCTLDSFTGTTKNNGSGALVVQKWAAAARELTVSYSGTLASEITAGDVLYFEGAYDGSSFYEMPGLLVQGSNTSGTSLGLSASTYPNWAGNSYSVGGNITADIVEDMASVLRDRGASSKLSLFVNNKNFSRLMAEVKTQRNFDASYSPEKAKVGVKAIEYETPDIGVIELVNHPFLMNGISLMLDSTDCARVGSADLQFGVPGSGEVDAPVWERVPNTNAAEVVLFSDQATILKMPSHALVGTGITVS
jgi:hypothetical protein